MTTGSISVYNYVRWILPYSDWVVFLDNNVMQLIDVSKIYNGETTQIDFEFEIQPEDTDILDLAFHKPVKVTGKVYEKARGKDRAESYVELVFFSYRENMTLTVQGAQSPLRRNSNINRMYRSCKKTGRR